MGMSVKNVLGFIWLSFTAIIWLRIANPLYNAIFGLDWTFSWTARMTKYILQIGFGMAIIGVGFYMPFKKFSDVYDKYFGEENNAYQ